MPEHSTAKPAKAPKAPTKRDLNLYQKLAAITGEIGIIKKGGKNSEQHYDFIEYAAVAGRIRDLFSEYGIVVVPSMAKSADQTRVEFASRSGSKGIAVLIDFEFIVINADNPADRMSVPWVGEAADFGDKATTKAATSALKYYLMRQFNISEKGDDPDGQSPDVAGATARPAIAAKSAGPEPATNDQRKVMFALMKKKGIVDPDDQKKVFELNTGLKSGQPATSAQASEFISKLNNDTFARPPVEEPIVDDTPPENPDLVVEDIDDVDIAESIAAAGAGEDTTFLITEDIKKDILSRLESIGLSGIGKIRFLKTISAKATSPAQLSDGQWMELDRKIVAVLDETEKLPDDWIATELKSETPKTKQSKSTGDDDGTGDIKNE